MQTSWTTRRCALGPRQARGGETSRLCSFARMRRCIHSPCVLSASRPRAFWRPLATRLRVSRPSFDASVRTLRSSRPLPQVEEDNRETMRLLRESGTAEKLEGLKRLIAQSAWATSLGVQAVSWGSLGRATEH